MGLYIYTSFNRNVCAPHTYTYCTSFISSTLCAAWHSKEFNRGVVNMLDRRCPLANTLEYLTDSDFLIAAQLPQLCSVRL